MSQLKDFLGKVLKTEQDFPYFDEFDTKELFQEIKSLLEFLNIRKNEVVLWNKEDP